VEIALVDFRNRWLPGLASDGILVGVNWSGPRATGYDLLPDQVLARLVVEAAESVPSGGTGETGATAAAGRGGIFPDRAAESVTDSPQ
jgi:hypothetical protein